MKQFRSTLIMALIAIGIGTYAYYEYKKSLDQEAAELKQGRFYPDLAMDQVVKLSVKAPNYVLVVAKEQNDWLLQEPVKDKADNSAVESFIRSMAEQQVKELDADSKTIDWVGYGIDDKSLQVEFTLKTGGSESFRVGTVEAYDGSRYLKRGDGDGPLYIGDKEWTRLLSKTPNDLRLKQIFKASDSPVQLTVTRKGQKDLTFEKIDNHWVYTGDKNLKIDGDTVENFISGFRSLRVNDFVAESKDAATLRKFGLHQPDGKVHIGDWEAQYATAKDGSVYLVASNREAVFKVTANDRDKWQKDLNDFRDRRFPFNLALDTVGALSYKSPSEGIDLVKKNNEWTLSEADEAKEVDGAQVQSLLDGIRGLEAKRFTAQQGPALPKMEQRLMIKDQQGQTVFEIGWGGKFKDGSGKNATDLYKVRTSLANESMVVEASRLDGLPLAQLVKPKQPQSVEKK